jgi:hypothetical protein
MTLVLVVVGGITISLLLTSWLIRKGRAERERWARRLREIASLPLAEAERRALRALTDTHAFRCIRSDGGVPGDLGNLADGLKRPFGRYRQVETATRPALRLDHECLFSPRLTRSLNPSRRQDNRAEVGRAACFTFFENRTV